jgi:hypothetical protein
MEKLRKRVLAAMLVASTFVGGAIGATVFSAGATSAKSTSTSSTPAASNGNQGAQRPSGTFRPNENKSHETGESAQREAQEDAGQFPTVP